MTPLSAATHPGSTLCRPEPTARVESLQSRAGRNLRWALRANALFSGLSGLTMISAAGALASFIGWQGPVLAIECVGGGLLVFALALAGEAWRARLTPWFSFAASGGDLAWVLGTLVARAVWPDALNAAGWWSAAVVATVVASCAIAQLDGIRRLLVENRRRSGGSERMRPDQT